MSWSKSPSVSPGKPVMKVERMTISDRFPATS